MIKKKRFGYVHLSRRLSGGKMPQVEIVDMKAEAGPISGRLLAEIKRTYNQGKQAILFLNRRGFSYFFQCNSCGFEVKCCNCSVPLTFHKYKNKLICHYCGYNTIPVSICPECKSMDIGYHGFGTQLIEQEIKKYFPYLSIKRVDTDSVRNKKRLIKLLKDFRAGAIDILLGTQMVAKGLNFPRVTLVGIISADTGLHIPDFRAAERTFGLIVQVAGRAGRFTREGKVIIQTFHKENEIIKLAAKANIEEYFNREIEYRRQLNFPPFSRLIRLVFRGKDKQKTFRQALRFRDFIIKDLTEYAQCLGPAECPLAMIARNYRYHLIFRTKNFLQLHSALRSSLSLFKPGHGVYMEVDVDPVSIL